MKVKILSLLLSVTLFFFAAVPARAAEGDYGFINILDYCTPNDSNDLQVYLGASASDIIFNNPVKIYAFNIDILVHISGQVPSQVSIINSNGSTESLEIVSIGNNLYRLIGNYGHSLENFTFRIAHTSPTTIEFFSFRVSISTATSFDETGVASLETYSYSTNINYDSNDTINGRTWTGAANYSDNWITVDAYIPDWKLYDRLDFQFTFSVSDINSITAFIGDQVLPCYISSVGDPSWLVNDFVISVSIDITNVNKDTTLMPTVHIEASAAPDESNTVAVFSMAGVVYSVGYEALPFWLNNIYSIFSNIDVWIDNQTDALVDAIKGNSTAADNFNSESADKNEQLQDMVGVMDSVQRPDINKLDPISNLNNSGADIAGGIGPVLTVPMQNPIILQVLILSLTFAMIAYVLYGKR